MVVNCREQTVIRRDAQLFSDPLRKLFPHVVGHSDELPRQQDCLASTIAEHDGTHINVIVNALESLRAASIPRHGECGVGGRCNVHPGGADL